MVQALKKKLKNEKGFTLIELLAVIVILGIISAIAIPAIGNLINHTKDKATVAEGVSIINAAKLYASTNDIETNTDLTKDQLAASLDNIKDDGYTVHVTFVSTGKYSYTLSDHNSVTVILGGTDNTKSVSESQLLNYK